MYLGGGEKVRRFRFPAGMLGVLVRKKNAKASPSKIGVDEIEPLANNPSCPIHHKQRIDSVKNTAEKSVTEVRIVEAAVQLFSRQGYKGTSTREIASLAGVNEATVFRYFARKTDLFWAAAEPRLKPLS